MRSMDTEMLQSLEERNFKQAQAKRKENIYGWLILIPLASIVLVAALVIGGLISPWFLTLVPTSMIIMVLFIYKSATYEEKGKTYREISTQEMLEIAKKLEAEHFSHLKTTLAKYVERGFMTCGELENIQSQVEEIENLARLTDRAEEWKRKAEELNQSTGGEK